jgi:hypothetical protein
VQCDRCLPLWYFAEDGRSRYCIAFVTTCHTARCQLRRPLSAVVP